VGEEGIGIKQIPYFLKIKKSMVHVKIRSIRVGGVGVLGCGWVREERAKMSVYTSESGVGGVGVLCCGWVREEGKDECIYV
jgi:hypothetical protein